MGKTNVVLGIDIGGTNTVLGLVDYAGNCYLKTTISTQGSEPAECFFDRLKSKIDSILKEGSDKFVLKGIGIGAPNANYYRGTVENPPNLCWGFVNVIDIIKKDYGVPASITNDANAAAIGEMKFGAAKEMKDFIVITLGTGVGSGIVCNGQLVYGADGFAGEIGHTIYDHSGRKCGCGRNGCLETYASAGGIRLTVMEMLKASDKPSVLRNLNEYELTAKKIYEAAVGMDEIAIDAFEFTGKVLGTKLADSVAHTSPEAIVLFGGLAAAGELIFEPTKRHMENNLLHIFRNKVKIIPSALPEGDAAVLGASALIWNEFEK